MANLRLACLPARRELEAINVGSAGSLTVDDTVYPLTTLDGLYVGKGSHDVSFQSGGAASSVRFFLMSAPGVPFIVANHQAILSPPWTIHLDCGTASYSLIWGMAGENLDSVDTDFAPISSLR